MYICSMPPLQEGGPQGLCISLHGCQLLPLRRAPLEFRKALTNEALKTEYADVVAWAKKIVEQHFPAATKV